MSFNNLKKNEIIKYNNDFQKINMSHLSTVEFRTWMYFLMSVKDQGDKEVKLTFSEIRHNVGVVLSKEEIFEYLKVTADKLMTQRITFVNPSNSRFITFSFFTKFEADKNKETLILRVNKEFMFIVNNIINKFSVLKWTDVKKIKSKYALIIYKKIRELYSLSKLEITYEKFKEILGIKDKKNKYINDKIISKFTSELAPYFKDFKMNLIKTGKTCPIQKIVFTWTYDKNEIFQTNEASKNEDDDLPIWMKEY